MMTKLEQAARQIIVDWDSGIHLYEAITALREALAEQADEIDWIETNKALAKEIIEMKKQAEQEQNSMFMEGYRIGLAEMREKCAKVVTEHAPTCSPHWVSYVVAIRAIKFEGDTGFRPASEMVSDHFAASGKPIAEQEPVAVVVLETDYDTFGSALSNRKSIVPYKPISNLEAGTKLYAAPVRTKDLTEQEPVGWYSHKGGFNECGEGQPLYAAPVRTKDLTDDEVYDVCKDIPFVVIGPDYDLAIARAVIAADREKNRV